MSEASTARSASFSVALHPDSRTESAGDDILPAVTGIGSFPALETSLPGHGRHRRSLARVLGDRLIRWVFGQGRGHGERVRCPASTPSGLEEPAAHRSRFMTGPARIARRSGHSTTTLLTVYAHCTDGQDHITNHQIDQALRQAEPPIPPGSERFHGPPAPAISCPSYVRERPSHGLPASHPQCSRHLQPQHRRTSLRR